MSYHKDITSREEFQEAIKTQGKYVLIYAYTGEMPQQASEHAKNFLNTTDPYKVNVDQFTGAKQFFPDTPTIVIYHNGQEVKKIVHPKPENMKEVAEMLSTPPS